MYEIASGPIVIKIPAITPQWSNRSLCDLCWNHHKMERSVSPPLHFVHQLSPNILPILEMYIVWTTALNNIYHEVAIHFTHTCCLFCCKLSLLMLFSGMSQLKKSINQCCSARIRLGAAAWFLVQINLLSPCLWWFCCCRADGEDSRYRYTTTGASPRLFRLICQVVV